MIQNNSIPCILIAFCLLIFTSSCKKDGDSGTTTVLDIDGNQYELVEIGTQTWLKQNLKTTKFKNGESILKVLEGDATWGFLPTAAMGIFNEDNSINEMYGSLYNWYATSDARGICPEGYHVPSKTEWTELIDHLGGASVAGDKLKEAGLEHWLMGNNGTNNSKFTALPGGFRPPTGISADTSVVAWFWSSTSESSNTGISYRLLYNQSDIMALDISKKYGFSCRCLQD